MKMVDLSEKMQVAVKDLPKALTDPALMEKLSKNMEEVGKEGEAGAREFEVVAKKYGLEDLDLGPKNK